MRLRNVPGAREVMIENKYVYTEPEGMSGTWAEVFGNNNPVRIAGGPIFVFKIPYDMND